MMRTLVLSIAVLMGGSAIAAPSAQVPPQKSGDQKPAAQKPADKKQDKKDSSLDALLDLEQEEREDGSDQGGAADAARREQSQELQRRLTEAEIADNFALAVQKMSISAELLDTKFEPGLGTQRVQEDIIARLELLIQQCKQCSSGGSSSSSSSSSSSAARDSQAKRSPGQQKRDAAQNQNANQPNQPGENRSELDPPPPQDGKANPALTENRSEWGNLPTRLRDQFIQGRRDKVSPLYQQLTDEYYRRLAEDIAP